jgi:hypothetical protein
LEGFHFPQSVKSAEGRPVNFGLIEAIPAVALPATLGKISIEEATVSMFGAVDLPSLVSRALPP